MLRPSRAILERGPTTAMFVFTGTTRSMGLMGNVVVIHIFVLKSFSSAAKGF